MAPDRRRANRIAAAILSAAALALAGCGVADEAGQRAAGAPQAPAPVFASVRSSDVGIHKIRHVVMIIQENRSFDSYFGTYPSADGIPAGRRPVSPCACPTR